MNSLNCSDSGITTDYLRQLTLFSGLSNAELTHLCEAAEVRDVPAGTLVIREGEPGKELFVILEGEVEVTKQRGGQAVTLDVLREGNFVGERALLERVCRTASVRTLRPSRLLVVQQDVFQRVFAISQPAMEMLKTATTRLERTEAVMMQREKLAALGTLAAGLAHELNNQAAVTRRGAVHLHEALAKIEGLAAQMSKLSLDQRQMEMLIASRAEIMSGTNKPSISDPLVRSQKEDEVQDWLDDHGVGESWNIGPVLVSCGWGPDRLESLAESFTEEQLDVVVQWLATSALSHELLHDVTTSSETISEIVKAVKTFSYLDQAPIQEIDVRDTLESTLTILRHRLKAGVNVVRRYSDAVPRIEAYASELNQVWTNLINNAVDAMQGQGELIISVDPKASETGEQVVVEITDNGPGIPVEAQAHIFEPFFTTKEVGVGTGLGLHLAYNTIVHHHHGDISFRSKPGMTTFRVTLPVRLTKDEPTADDSNA